MMYFMIDDFIGTRVLIVILGRFNFIILVIVILLPLLLVIMGDRILVRCPQLYRALHGNIISCMGGALDTGSSFHIVGNAGGDHFRIGRWQLINTMSRKR